jgi:LacI family transcriptional regulator
LLHLSRDLRHAADLKIPPDFTEGSSIMMPIVHAPLAFVVGMFRSRIGLQLEIVALRHQLVLSRRSARRPRIRPYIILLTSDGTCPIDNAYMKTLSLKTKTTLAAVARQAGVSIVTASRALNANPLVAKATRDRILAAQTALGYTPNLLARGLVTNRTATVGVVIPELANPFFGPMVSAIESIAAKRRFLTIVGESRREEAEERLYVDQFRQFRIGGVVVSPATTHLEHLVAARAAGIPVIVMAWPWSDGDYVATDDVQGGRLAAQHLLARGHRRIGIVRMAKPEHAPIQARIHGFRDVLASADTSVRDTWNLQLPGTQIEDGIAAADRVLALRTRPTALFVSSDRIAIGLIHRLLARGIRVPEDIALVGYDDIPYAMAAQVPLTTVAVPKRSLGERAANLLFQRYDDKGSAKPRQILLPPELVVRASCP